MISIEEKNRIEKEFLEKYPNDILTAWDNSHYDVPRIINENGYKTAVEIGVAYGGHSEMILLNTKIEKLYGVDPYKNYSEYDGDCQNFEQRKQDDVHEMVSSRLSYYGGRFELLRDYSDNVLDKFKDESLDIVYIDGNHFEEFIKRDVSNWWKKVRVGGVLSGHDYDHPSFPVTSIVNDFFMNLNLDVINLGNHNWCVYKK